MSEKKGNISALTEEARVAFDCIVDRIGADALLLLIDTSFETISEGGNGAAITPPQTDGDYRVSVTREGFTFACGGDEPAAHTIPVDLAQEMLETTVQ